ncbi:MAG TPA: MauE/DoxX family redox-associated membrane protein [Thermoleophilaceae bacterium]|nr:MauE/DoxX family redox-associated membrane protein [Thermoleophilaceae bacterium]
MDTVELALRIVLAVVFATAGVGKLLDLEGSRRAMQDFGVSEGAARAVGLLLPLAELVTAILLIFEPTAQVGAVLAALLLAAFIAGIANALRKGQEPDCHCFGQIHSAPAGKSTLIRNGVLLAAALVVAIGGSGPAIDDWVSARSAAELAAIGIGILAIAALAYAWNLRETNQRLRNDLDISRRAGAVGGRFGLPVGTMAPVFELPDLSGEMVTLNDLLAPDRPILLMFMGPMCGPCHAMLPKLRQWQDTLRDRLTIAVISTGTAEQNESIAQEGIEHVLLQQELEVNEAFSVRATPSALVVARDGFIASHVGETEQAIEPLVRAALRRGMNIVTVEDSAA